MLQMMVKNFMFYAFSTFVNTWSGQQGPATVFRTFGIVTLCLLATCIPMCKCPAGWPFCPIRDTDVEADIFGKVNRRFMYRVYQNSRLFRAIA